MKILQNSRENLVSFSDLCEGAVFQYNNHIFIKIKPVKEDVILPISLEKQTYGRNAIRLSRGFSVLFKDEDQVVYHPDATLYLKG